MCLSIGLQLYSIKDKTAADFKSALRKVVETVYENLKKLEWEVF
ncbi:hypothetical protein [Clostridium pasteurianum]|nr:hypothetical protein [Clostridium pasteurianum]